MKVKLGDDHPHTISTMNNLANLYSDQGKYEAAEPLYVKCLEKMKVKLGDDHPNTIASMGNLANLYKDQGRYEAAESLYKKCIGLSIIKLGNDHPYTNKVKRNYEILKRKMI
jgi:tetratricopeptide (TPR) repeat protein